MHELSLAQSIIEIVIDELPKHGLTKVNAITLKLGEMTQLFPDSLLFGFECLSQGTSLEGAQLVIDRVPPKGRCMRCGQEFLIRNWECRCPGCGDTEIVTVSGKELEIVELDGS